jgi:2-polyprenyl-3-methyl-5-hydroxy-6-metoxy-1,4-benzoquinol methylase
MSYDWRQTISAPQGSSGYFNEIDQRFFTAFPFYAGDPPFSRLIPFGELASARVLEIGCGLGSHAQLLAQSGCILTAIDLTDTAVETSRRRLGLQGLSADVLVMDAGHLDFPDNTFDLV